MAKKSMETTPSPSNATTPLFFADQPAALMLGPHVSRITFGVEEMDDGEFPRPVVEIAIPTVALLQFVNDVKEALSSSDFKKQTVGLLEKSAKTIVAGRAVKDDQFEKVKSARKSSARALKKPSD